MSHTLLPLIAAQAIPGRSGVVLMARVVGANRTLITQASVSGIAYGVWNLTDDEVVQASAALVVADTVYDDLQQSDGAWTKDSREYPGADGRWGYNWRTVLSATLFTVANSGDRMRADCRVTPVSGESFLIPFEWDSLVVYI